jgi:hypothetical protein
MSIVASGLTRIRHADTGVVYTIEADELDWNEVGADERKMGSEVTHEATLDHPELGLLTWTLWEYPLGMENDREVDVGRHTVLEGFSISLVDDEGWALERESRIQQMVDWFFENFQDPANSLPYESAEGGYIWIDGGPYDALEQIGDNFSGEDQALIEAAVERVQSDGLFDWARIERPEDFDYEPEEPGDAASEPADGVVRDGGFSDQASLKDILASVPPATGPIFEPDEHHRLELARWVSSPSPDSSLLKALRSKASDLRDQLRGSNGHPEMQAAAEQYLDAVDRDPLSISGLYAAGVNLENISDWTSVAIKADERPPLPGSSAGTLRTTLDLHGVVVASTAEGSALIEAAARYRRLPEEQDALSRSVAEVAELVQEAKDVFGPQARTLIGQAANQTGTGPNPARSNQTSVTLVAGALRAMALIVGAGLFDAVVVAGLAETTALVGAKQGVTALANAAGTFLAGHADVLRTFAAAVGPELSWLGRLADWFRARRPSSITR